MSDKNQPLPAEPEIIQEDDAAKQSRTFSAMLRYTWECFTHSLKSKLKKDAVPPVYQGKGVLMGMDVFFAHRILGLLASMVALIVGVAVWGIYFPIAPRVVFALLATVVAIGGILCLRLAYIARGGKYFVLQLMCAAIHYPKLPERGVDVVKLRGSSLLRQSQKVTFLTMDEQVVVFTFDRPRRFVESYIYAFYFRLPSPAEATEDGNVSLEMLERLIIDYTPVQQTISGNVINLNTATQEQDKENEIID